MKHEKDFEVLFKEGRFVRGMIVSATVWKIQKEIYPRRKYNDDTLRIGFIVSKKIEKKAVHRNRVKRMMREAVRIHMKDHSWAEGYLVAFVASSKATTASFDDMYADIEHITKKIGLV
jgi:ribonuclease P protein component